MRRTVLTTALAFCMLGGCATTSTSACVQQCGREAYPDCQVERSARDSVRRHQAKPRPWFLPTGIGSDVVDRRHGELIAKAGDELTQPDGLAKHCLEARETCITQCVSGEDGVPDVRELLDQEPVSDTGNDGLHRPCFSRLDDKRVGNAGACRRDLSADATIAN